MGDIGLVAMVEAADAVVIVVLVLSSGEDIGLVAMVAAAADAVVIVVLVLSSGETSAW